MGRPGRDDFATLSPAGPLKLLTGLDRRRRPLMGALAALPVIRASRRGSAIPHNVRTASTARWAALRCPHRQAAFGSALRWPWTGRRPPAMKNRRPPEIRDEPSRRSGVDTEQRS